jgi:hypothetical protein
MTVLQVSQATLPSMLVLLFVHFVVTHVPDLALAFVGSAETTGG